MIICINYDAIYVWHATLESGFAKGFYKLKQVLGARGKFFNSRFMVITLAPSMQAKLSVRTQVMAV